MDDGQKRFYIKENKQRLLYNIFSKNCLFFLKSMWGKEGSVFFTPFAKFHQLIIEGIMKSKKLITVVQVTREFGKTKILSFGFIIWAILFMKYAYVLHMSFSLERKGEQIMRDLQRGFMSPIFVKLFGDWRGKFWGKHKIHLYSSKWKVDAIIEVTGADQSVFGASEWSTRPDLIILDDIETLKTVKNPDMVNALVERFQTEIIPAAEAKDRHGRQAKILIIGTPLAAYSFLTIVSAWKSNVRVFKFPCIVDDKVVVDSAFKSKKMSELLGLHEGMSIWEERFSTIWLQNRRQFLIDTGAYQTWLSQYMLDPVSETPMQFRQDKFKEVTFKEIQPLLRQGRIITLVDMAYTERTQNDFVGIATSLHLPGSRIVTLESQQIKCTPNILFDVLYNLKEKYSMAGDYVTAAETKHYQLVKQYFWEVEIRTNHHLEVLPLPDRNRHKNDRIGAMIPFYEVGLLEFVEGTNNVLRSQMFTWFGKTVGQDDVIDAWAYNRDFVELSEDAVAEQKKVDKEINDDLQDMSVVNPDKYSGAVAVQRYLDQGKEEEDGGDERDFFNGW